MERRGRNGKNNNINPEPRRKITAWLFRMALCYIMALGYIMEVLQKHQTAWTV